MLDDGAEAAVWLAAGQKSYDVTYTRDATKTRGRLHHIAFFVDQREDVLRAADIFLEHGIVMESGPHKHAIQQTFFLYTWEPGGNRIEVSSGGYLILRPTTRRSSGRRRSARRGRRGGCRRFRASTSRGRLPFRRRRCCLPGIEPFTRARELVRGAYDLHVHVEPDLATRRIDDLSLARASPTWGSRASCSVALRARRRARARSCARGACRACAPSARSRSTPASADLTRRRSRSRRAAVPASCGCRRSTPRTKRAKTDPSPREAAGLAARSRSEFVAQPGAERSRCSLANLGKVLDVARAARPRARHGASGPCRDPRCRRGPRSPPA